MNIYRVLIPLVMIFFSGCTSINSLYSDVNGALNSENVLFIEDVKLDRFSAIPEGYVAKYLVTNFEGEEHLAEHRFIGVENGGYIFKTFIDGKPFLNRTSILKNGRIYSYSKNSEYDPSDNFENCDQYFIGECITDSNRIRIRTYENGIWQLKYKTLGLTSITIKTVYDQYGLILYYENVNERFSSIKVKSTTVRIQ